MNAAKNVAKNTRQIPVLPGSRPLDPSQRPLAHRDGRIRTGCLLVLAIGASLLLIGVLMVALTVDDWGRDLSTNTAETDPQHPDPDLRPLVLEGDLAEVRERIRRTAAELPRWQVVADAPDDPAQLRLEHRTRWLGYVDDVTVTLERLPTAVRLNVRSQSRVGKGDLGQNPRNIRQLMRALRSSSQDKDRQHGQPDDV
jgi:uncharacterized protein (DUF1499 family)